MSPPSWTWNCCFIQFSNSSSAKRHRLDAVTWCHVHSAIYIHSDTSRKCDSHMFFWWNSESNTTSIHLMFHDVSSDSQIQHDFEHLIRGKIGLTVLGIALHKHCRMTPLGRCMNWRAHLRVFGVVVIWHCPSCRDVATVWLEFHLYSNKSPWKV